ncbi:glycosyltransferase family 9 protein [Cupriavidus sp. AU9028]|uniref:glycosyltransferase family 9 protein n=1 Tax=Cupriavidus sp. AU9028 TaxID=2871157 RepID=UPI001C954C64|nr:glycosyltransferase family 9 protein [Cupriavidus sp. AU9028]MBY4896082.1 glycosyltransferase family 9 protein [Cupriavidus sp. AU9028]
MTVASARPRQIAVFRALQLGDMLVAVPALRALRKGEPDATITLIGLPWAASFAERFSALVDDHMAFPGAPGMPEQPVNDAQVDAFYAEARQRQFDLAIQLHGSGQLTNGIVRRLGARAMAGFRPAGSPAPSMPPAGPGEAPDDPYRDMPTVTSLAAHRPRETLIEWPEGNEVERLAALPAALGYPVDGLHLDFPLSATDLAGFHLLAHLHGLQPGNYICVHPGARMQSRRWPIERFAAAAAALAKDWKVVVTGTPDEAELAERLCQGLGPRAVNLCGRTDLGTMAAVVRHARLLLCNDTGASHIAAAMRTPSVVVSCGSDSARWAPLDASLHKVLADYPECRPCMHVVCPIGHVCARGIGVEQVVTTAMALASAPQSKPVTEEMSHA